ncbi:MAG: 50S ribosomal protein L5, partial [Verrucomicrobia bacterium]|nr:50S ribosomal protein L5 [Verrucomicrobiota bacterium]
MKATRLYQKYVETVRPALIENWKYTNVHQVPQVEKIVIRMGWDTSTEKGAVDEAIKELMTITGRKPVPDRARKSVANFKLRKGQQIGCHVTLRREVMFEFL